MTARRALALALAACLAALPATAAASLPQIDYTLSGPAGDNGWYTGPVTVHWLFSANTSSASCPGVEQLAADTLGTQRSCTASNADGPVTAQTKVIKIDQTPPVAVAASPVRPPDHPPFYTAPLPITWSGADVTSGIAGCTALSYAGPDGPTATATGACRDRAGNVSAPVAITFAYDATAPTLTDVAATLAADRTATLRWTPGADAATATVTRNPGGATLLDGPATTRAVTDGPLPPAATYTYTITVRDTAGNATSATATATAPTAAAIAASQAKAKSDAQAKANARRTVLRWRARRGAKYYNFQLFRNGRKILSAWPTKPHYTLRTTWRYRGATQKLTAGRYRWYVWPGYGGRAAHRYGRLLAKGVVRYPAPPIRDGGQ
jgi:hypothetical protein